MKTLGYYNGKYDEYDRMLVPMSDRVCFFGDGVYDATYSGNYVVFTLDEHLDRFYSSASMLGINIPMPKQELGELICSLVKKLDDGNQFVYWQVTRGSGVRKHDYDESAPGNIWIVLRPCGIVDTYKKIRCVTAEDTRFLHCNIKTLNLIPSVMAAHRAGADGCQETIFHRGERVTECAHSNVHIISDGVFRTAPTDNLILPGIARRHLINACGRLGIPVAEEPFTVKELFEADEIIVSSAGSLCLAVEQLDGRPVGGGAPLLLKKLQDEVRGEFFAVTGV